MAEECRYHPENSTNNAEPVNVLKKIEPAEEINGSAYEEVPFPREVLSITFIERIFLVFEVQGLLYLENFRPLCLFGIIVTA